MHRRAGRADTRLIHGGVIDLAAGSGVGLATATGHALAPLVLRACGGSELAADLATARTLLLHHLAEQLAVLGLVLVLDLTASLAFLDVLEERRWHLPATLGRRYRIILLGGRRMWIAFICLAGRRLVAEETTFFRLLDMAAALIALTPVVVVLGGGKLVLPGDMPAIRHAGWTRERQAATTRTNRETRRKTGRRTTTKTWRDRRPCAQWRHTRRRATHRQRDRQGRRPLTTGRGLLCNNDVGGAAALDLTALGIAIVRGAIGTILGLTAGRDRRAAPGNRFWPLGACILLGDTAGDIDGAAAPGLACVTAERTQPAGHRGFYLSGIGMIQETHCYLP